MAYIGHRRIEFIDGLILTRWSMAWVEILFQQSNSSSTKLMILTLRWIYQKIINEIQAFWGWTKEMIRQKINFVVMDDNGNRLNPLPSGMKIT